MLDPSTRAFIKQFLLEANPNPERNGCPTEQTIKALAEDRLQIGAPAGLHLGSCSECFAEYSHYRLDRKESRRSQIFDNHDPSLM